MGYARTLQRPDGKLVTAYYYYTARNIYRRIVASPHARGLEDRLYLTYAVGKFDAIRARRLYAEIDAESSPIRAPSVISKSRRDGSKPVLSRMSLTTSHSSE